MSRTKYIGHSFIPNTFFFIFLQLVAFGLRKALNEKTHIVHTCKWKYKHFHAHSQTHTHTHALHFTRAKKSYFIFVFV